MYFCALMKGASLHHKFIGRWCNGNTTDSGPVIEGSNPSRPTQGSWKHGPFFYFNRRKTALEIILSKMSYNEKKLVNLRP